MSLTSETLTGTLHSDGTIELDSLPTLLAGRVKVILEPDLADTTPPGLTDRIDMIRQNQQARGFQGRDADEIEAGLSEGEAEYERNMHALRVQL